MLKDLWHQLVELFLLFLIEKGNGKSYLILDPFDSQLDYEPEPPSVHAVILFLGPLNFFPFHSWCLYMSSFRLMLLNYFCCI